jgi:5,10-methylene-tetrahydrofolate dehydrogenase/methenyl tetrahydrofolate cyclohydrolase
MSRALHAQDLAEFIKERQAHQVRSLRQSKGVHLKMAAPGSVYAEACTDYAEDIGIEVAPQHPQADISDAVATAIMWLCAGYAVELRGRKVVLVGQHLSDVAAVLKKSGSNVELVHVVDDDLASRVMNGEIVIVDSPKVVLTSAMLRPASVLIEVIPGGAEPAVFARHDVSATIQNQGLVPLTVAAMVDSLINA